MGNYLKDAGTALVNPPQSEPLNERQVANSAGGYVFPVDDWTRLDRFLVLGSEGGSYYATEQKLTKDNAQSVERCIASDGPRTVRRIVEISDGGRAPKNDPALFALAMCAGSKDTETRTAALAALPKVARIGTHLFHFAEYVQLFRGWGRALRGAVADWYLNQSIDQIQNQLVKYQQRDGWTHRDLLRLSHPKADTTKGAAFKWAVKGDVPELPLIQAFEKAKSATPKDIAALIREHGLTREMVPTEALTSLEVWDALLEKMPMTAMIRNLANMTRVELLKPMSKASALVCERLAAVEILRKARIHPIQALIALKTYASGHGERGKNVWTPVQQVVDALNEAFYLCFQNVEPTGKRWYLGVDVSGSMDGGRVAGCDLTPREGACAMALMTARTEKQHVIRGFQSGGGGYGGQWDNGRIVMAEMNISPKQRLDDVIRIAQNIPMGGTDCAMPMLDALQSKLEVDVFCVLTDSETWAGKVHPVKALQEYRKQTGIPAKLIVVGMVSNGFTIADPLDGGMMDVCGFDAAVPNIMSDFVRQ